MPTLAEIMAKKAAAKAQPAVTVGPGRSFPPVQTGTVIRKEDEKAKMSASIKMTLDASAPKAFPPVPRELGEMQAGETIPMDHPDPDDDNAREWFNSLHSFASDLGIVIEPDGWAAWIAVKAKDQQKPVLLCRLPLINNPTPGQPF